eukprot:TRINITY_DN1096_c0_g1_i3.p2 TRINITY_DN1096_c0_g1~~TRINITY_DN1096_c0_g1_i3.p2  ORF type:complete len:464 (-),score=52.45 TRINITY_DN1096_c0_g1_i3:2149-3540(-)
MLYKNQSITHLDLRFCELTDDCVSYIIRAIDKHPIQIEEILLLGNHLSPESEERVKKAMNDRTGGKKLERLLSLPTLSSLHSGNAGAGMTDSPTRAGTSSSLSADRSPKTPSSARLDIPVGTIDAITAERLLKRIDELQRVEGVLQARVAELEADRAKNMDKEKKKVSGEVKRSKLKINLKNVQINEQLAEAGGSGAVIYNCLVDGWQCAMKEMNLRDVPEYSMKSFETEIELLERLPFHPNIVRYLFHERKGDKLRLFMTKYSTSLRRIIQRRKKEVEDGRSEPFTALEIAKWSSSIAAGLEFLHKQHVVHRDMKPDNVLATLDAHDEVQTLAISDFDTAKTVTKSQQAKTVIGTPSYMAPEVISSQNRDLYGYKADVWSFGMTLYELMTLKEPYEDEDKFEVATMISTGARPKMPASMPSSYKPLMELYETLTVKDPKARPELRDVRDSLQQLQWTLQSSD